ncbi:MAG: cache domain-containing protein [Desulforhopalus sp.]|nr:cache domain-containing protein [Desulforhopalus sp.]
MRSIKTTFFRNMMLITLASVGLLFVLWMHSEYTAFVEDANHARKAFEESQKEMLKEEVTTVADYINYTKNLTESVLRKTVRDRVVEASSVASHLLEVYGNSKSPAEVQLLIKDALRQLRFNDGRGYYFIFNLNGIEELFADRPELEGQNMLTLQGAKGEFVVRDMINLVRESGEGFYSYTWTKPGEAGNTYQKTAYVKSFPAYDWVIGTGEYVEDVRDDIQKQVLERLITLKFGREGYFFGSTGNGLPLFTNGKITVGERSIADLTDSQGVKIFAEYKKATANPGGDFIRYSWQKLDSPTPSPKISFVTSIPGWQWIIGAGVYLDTVEEEIAKKKDLLFDRFLKKTLISFSLLFVLILLVYFWVRRLTGTIQNGIDAFSRFCIKAATENILIDPGMLKFQEFIDIARSTNMMLEGQRQATEELVKSEEKYRTLFENMVHGVFCQLSGGALVDVNQSALNMLGRSREEFLGTRFDNPSWKVVREDGSLLAVEEYPSVVALQTGKPVINFVAGVFNQVKDSWVWLNINAIPQFKPGEDKPFQVFVTLHDITLRKAMERALRQSEEQFRTLTDLAPVGVYLASSEGYCQYVNPRWCEMTGLTADEAKGEGWLQGLHPDDVGRVLSSWREMVAGRTTWDTEYRLRNGDGKVVWVQGLAAPQRDEQGRIVRYIGINVDITRRKEDEDQRLKLEAQLQQAQRLEAIGTLAGGIAHDFNNILGAILGYAEMARDDSPPDSSVARDLSEILSAGARAKDLIKQILAFSRQVNTERRSVRPAVIVHEAVRLLRPSLPSTIEIKQEIDEAAGPVLADPTQLHQILVNLCTNAFHAMEETGGILHISLKNSELRREDLGREPHVRPGVFAHLSVSDTGTGIAPELVARIFEPYFTTKEVGKGTGMGLAIVHGIVRSYEGFVSCSSLVGKGTTVHVYLPVIAPGAMAAEEGEELVLAGRERILIVDDEKILAEMGKNMLERLGYEVTVETNSLEAIATFFKDPDQFDLILTDQTMPGMTGLDLAMHILTIRPDLPVILCTGYSTLVTEEKAKAAGIKGFAMKPLAKRDIARLIRKVLDEGKR